MLRMLQEKKGMLLIIAAILVVLITFLIPAPQFLFREIRITNEINRLNRYTGVNELERISLKDFKIADCHGSWSSIYAKLELNESDYERLKWILLDCSGTTTHKDYSDEITNEASRYNYDPSGFSWLLRNMNRIKRAYNYSSINLDDYEELLILDVIYGKWFSSGTTIYALTKENDGKHYLYIFAA